MRIATCLVLVILPIIAACGSNPAAPAPSSGTDSLTSVIPLTGTAARGPYGDVSFFGGDLLVGDNDGYQPNQLLRGLVTFNIKAIPRASTITSAMLQMDQCLVRGSPFTTLGQVVVDHVPVETTPDTSVFDTTATAPGIAVLSSDTSTGLKLAAVTTSIAADRSAGDTLTSFRLRFSSADGNDNGTSDNVVFRPDSTVNYACQPFVSGHAPLLIVSFQ
jgi:hypothetical protein